MIWRYGLLFLLLLTAAYAECIGYQESFDVRVLDGKQRPVEGAEVSITYDRGTSFGEQYFTTPPVYTNSEGRVHYSIINQGTTTREIDCDIDISVSAGGSAKEKTVVANAHGPTVDVILTDVYIVRFYVRDHLNAPLANATVGIGKRTNLTNEDGYVRYYLQTGDYEYFASYLEAKDAGILSVETEDVDYQVTFPYYKVVIDVMDDFGEPLDALITMQNETFQLENGHFENNRSFGSKIPYEVDYKGLITSGSIMTDVDPTATIIYDIHAPTIEKVEPEVTPAITKLVLTVSEPGEHPSGVDVNTIKVRYRLEPADPTTPWNEAVVFASGYNMYTAQFSDLPPDSIVQFTVELKDLAGNRASREGKFSTLTVEEPPANVTQNQTITQEDEETEQEIPLFYIIGGVILVILTIYLGIRLKSKGTEGM